MGEIVMGQLFQKNKNKINDVCQQNSGAREKVHKSSVGLQGPKGQKS